MNRDNILRYLGYKDQVIEPALNNLIDEMTLECARLIKPRHAHRFFDLAFEERGVVAQGLVLEGQSISAHLRGAGKAAVMAVTLGAEIDQAIRRYEVRDMTRALILDAAAAEAIEEACDQSQQGIGQEALAMGLYTGNRFSPGYGDLPLDIQPALLRALNARKIIGLTCTNTLIMIPRKSVTAIIGLFPEPVIAMEKNCTQCNLYKDCEFKQGGGRCGPEHHIGT